MALCTAVLWAGGQFSREGQEQFSCGYATAGITPPSSLPVGWVRGRDVLVSFSWVLDI